MKKLFLIFLFQLFLCSVKAGDFTDMLQQQVIVDTGIIKDPIEDEIIAEVIKTKAPPQKEKVMYFSQVTKWPRAAQGSGRDVNAASARAN